MRDIAHAVDDFTLKAINRLISRIVERCIRRKRNVAAQGVCLRADIHTRLRHERPRIGDIQKELHGAEHARLLRVAGGLDDLFAACRERRSVNAELSERRPNRKLRCIGVFLLGQAAENGILAEIKTEEGVKRVLRIAVGEHARRLGAGRIFALDGQRPAGEMQPMIDAVRGAGQAVVGRVGIAPRAEGSSRRGFQIEMTGAEGHVCGLAAVLNG